MKKGSKAEKQLFVNTKANKRGKAELTNSIGFRVDHSFVLAIEKYCKEHKIPKSNLYRYCLENGFKNLTRKRKAKK